MKFVPAYKMSPISGFTLIEILLVAVLLGVCAGLVLPNFSQTYKGVLLKNSVSDLAYLMRYAQSRAISMDRQLRLEFTQDFKGYSLTEEISSVADEPEFGRIKNHFGRTILIPAEVQVLSQVPLVHFFSDGHMDKVDISFCQEKKCYIVTTKKRRGQVDVLAAATD